MAPLSMSSFFYSQLFLFVRLPLLELDLSGQTVIVTGSNVGLGKEAARQLARINPSKLILAVRNVPKGEDAAKDINSSTGNRNVEVWELDLASFDSVKKFSDRVNKELKRLDILLHNAGIATDQWRETVDGYESTLQVNGVSTALLALLTLSKLRETISSFKTKPHVVIVGSEVHHWTKAVEMQAADPIKALNDKEKFLPGDRYRISKLLSLYIARSLADSLANSSHSEDESIIVNCVNPGLCHSELGKDAGWGLYIAKLVLARTSEYGARNLVWAALAGQESHGEYISDCSVQEASDFAISAAGLYGQKKTWKALQQIFAKSAPESTRVF